MTDAQKKNRYFLVAGCILVGLTLLPCLVLGEDAIFTYHDQLDGEVIAYLLQAKHLGVNGGLPEFLGGASKTALLPPAPAAVLLFRIFSPLVALYLMQLMGSLIGYLGMFLLVRECTGNPLAAFVAGGLYAMIPFLPVYGMAQYGLPLLAWAVLRMPELSVGQGKRNRLPGFCIGILFALNSSLVLDGFAVLSVLAVRILWQWLKRKRFPGMQFGLWLAMLGVYLVTNFSLVLQVLGIGTQEVSHKTEYALAAEPVLPGMLQAFFYGGQHSADHHLGILVLAAAVLIPEQIRLKKRAAEQESSNDKLQKIVWACLGWNLMFAVVSALWNSSVAIAARNHLGAAGAFQMDRFLWLAPCLWYLILGCLVAYLTEGLERLRDRARESEPAVAQRTLVVQKAGMAAAIFGCLLVLAGTGLALFRDSDIKSNLQKLRNPDYPVLSFRDYYAVGVLDQVRDYLWQEKGLSQEKYHVASIGIDPAAALYHGFYCLDGYSNNYSLAYKHAFRRVIAPALAQSEYLRAYFDDWGNRCYLFGTESPGYYTIEKNGFYFQHLELDTKALRELGGDYLLSAAYIANSEELGLKLVRQEPFETQESYYRIFLYEVADETQ